MDPLSAWSIATSIVTFVDFGTKLVSLYLDIQRSEDGRPAVLSALETESRELSGNASHARAKVADLQARYPQQFKPLARLNAECAQVEKDLRSLADSLTVKPGHGLRARGAQARAAIRGMRKQGDIEGLQGRLRSIREQTIMSVIMCISDDVTESRATLNGVDSNVGEVMNILRPMKTTIDTLQPGFDTSRHQPLATAFEKHRMTSGLWTSIAATDHADAQTTPCRTEGIPANDSDVCERILRSLKFEEMTARESQIEDPFPETFQWLLGDGGSNSDKRWVKPPFQEWLESQANETPFWITGSPASGKSTLMKFICTHPRLQSHLQEWSGELGLLVCSVYFWNPGSPGQKSQAGLLRTILYQLIHQRPHLCRMVVSRRYLYFQLAGVDSPDPEEWTVEELRDCVTRFISQIEGTDCLAIFIDGLDEYEGDLRELISFLKQLHRGYVKFCVSSRPWNIFRDEFHMCPSLRMELLTKSDICNYVRTRLGSSPAFQELRELDCTSVEDLEFQIIDRAGGVFLWVVLVVEKLITTARENNDLREIWSIFNASPPGLKELYCLMRERLDQASREKASKMYQLLLLWDETSSELNGRPCGAVELWMALNCHDPTKPRPYPTEDKVSTILPVLERALAGATGGILQLVPPGTSVGYLHRTVFDWLQDNWSSIVNDGPEDYDPGLALTSVLVSRGNHDHSTTDVTEIFRIGASCNASPETRSKLLAIIEALSVADGRNRDRWYLDDQENAILSPYSNTAVRSFLAARSLCAPYLQAQLESSSGATGLEMPRKLRMMPRRFWDEPRKALVARVLDTTTTGGPGSRSLGETIEVMNMRLGTFEILVRARVAPRHVLVAGIKVWLKVGYGQQGFWQVLLDGLEGRGFVEMTTTENDVTTVAGMFMSWEHIIGQTPLPSIASTM